MDDLIWEYPCQVERKTRLHTRMFYWFRGTQIVFRQPYLDWKIQPLKFGHVDSWSVWVPGLPTAWVRRSHSLQSCRRDSGLCHHRGPSSYNLKKTKHTAIGESMPVASRCIWLQGRWSAPTCCFWSLDLGQPWPAHFHHNLTMSQLQYGWRLLVSHDRGNLRSRTYPIHGPTPVYCAHPSLLLVVAG